MQYVVYFRSFCHEVNTLIPLLTESKNIVLRLFLKVRFNFDYLIDQTYYNYIWLPNVINITQARNQEFALGRGAVLNTGKNIKRSWTRF